MPKQCMECGAAHLARGLCKRHYESWFAKARKHPDWATTRIQPGHSRMLPQSDCALARGELTQFDIGYIMGLAVGEGSFTGSRRAKACFVLLLTAADRGVLEHLQRLIGGSIYGPFGPYYGNQKPSLRLSLGYRDLRAAVPLFREYLPPSLKRQQFDAWSIRYDL